MHYLECNNCSRLSVSERLECLNCGSEDVYEMTATEFELMADIVSLMGGN